MAVPLPIIVEEITDPAELARARAQDERHRRNQEWRGVTRPMLRECTGC